MDLVGFEKILQKSWTQDTSYYPNEWDSTNPSFGQCAVSALVVNDYFGGEIIWTEALLPDGQKISHYFNFIHGKEVDFTRNQFPECTIIPKGIKKNKTFQTTREFILSDADTNSRYQLLKKKV